jgi:hypothetical protein
MSASCRGSSPEIHDLREDGQSLCMDVVHRRPCCCPVESASTNCVNLDAERESGRLPSGSVWVRVARGGGCSTRGMSSTQ